MRWIVLVLLGAMVAGCADSAEAGPEATEETSVGYLLRGVVVSEAIQPIAGATVTLQPADRQNATDSEGGFRFTDLDPGAYTLTVEAPGYLSVTQIAAIRADGTSDVVKVVLPTDVDAVAYVSEYYFKGFYECGVPLGDDITCSNINIITWIILGIGNVTTDRSLFLQWIGGIPDFLQTELVWESSQALGDRLGFAVGGATEEQLSTGQATTHNYTYGESPLVLTIGDAELEESGIGGDRALLTQVFAAPYQDIPGGCVYYSVCGPGLQLMQEFETFTHAFYNRMPIPGWQFSVDGSP